MQRDKNKIRIKLKPDVPVKSPRGGGTGRDGQIDATHTKTGTSKS
jgi:hypothetical protein